MQPKAHQIESILAAAVEIGPEAERRQFVEQACAGDAELKRRVEELIENHFRAGSFLEAPAHTLATADEPLSERPGTAVGPYKLLEQLGEGGFGVVFLAEQQQPVRRKVALKVLKPGMDTRQVVARFEAERQALALMDHPNIAHVFDGGATASGRPYFVMELVRGAPLTDFCDQGQLGIRERLGLFVSVCQAVQHAHQKGVIHRDLKPSNVLVTLYDSKAVPKVIDFGVAKATGQQLTEKTLFTHFAQMVGTPLYMSPEQAGMSELDVDTRSDVYSLGVLLYELLTGTTPFEKSRFSKVGYDEMRRIIREEEPARPSMRISTLGQAATTASANRNSDPKRLSQLLRGELDWVVMRALEKDRNRRYETANGFAKDVQRYLHDEPVQACPPSVGYRFRKFARRNKRALVMASVVTVALVLVVAALAGSIGWAARDKAARDRDVVGHLEEAERWERQGDWAQALRAVERAEGRLAGGGPVSLRQRAEQVRERVQFVADLEESRLQYSAVRDDHFDDAGADGAYAEAFKSHGWDVQALAAEEIAERIAASPIRMHLVAALDHWASIKDVAGAERLLNIARLADDDDWRRQLRDPAVRKDRAALERLALQEGVLDQPPGSLVLLAGMLDRRGALPAAVDLLQRAQQQHPDDFWINHDLAFHLEMKLARLEEAVGFYRAAVALRPQSPGAHLNLGSALAHQRKPAAEAAFRKAIALKPDYGAAYNGLGVALRHQGRHKEAEAASREAIRLMPDYPGAHDNLGLALNSKGKHKEAEAACREAIRLKPDFPQAHDNLGDALNGQGKQKEAETAYRQALALFEKQASAHPRDPEYGLDWAGTQVNFGHFLRDRKRLDEALTWYDRGLALLEPLHKQAPNDVTTQRFLRNAHWGRASTLWRLQRPAEALPHWDRALELSPPADPGRPQMQCDLAGTQVNYAIELHDKHHPEKALPWYDRALALLEPLHKQAPDDVTIRSFLRNAHTGRAWALYELKRYAEALRHWDRAVELSPPNEQAVPRMERAVCWARDGKVAEAVADAEALTKDAAAPGNLLYNAACVYALASAAVKDDAKQREAYAGHALALIGRARVTGFFTERKLIEHLKKDTPFDVLRSREDFKKFVAELETAPKP